MKFKYFYCLYVLAVLYVASTLLALAGVDMYIDVTSFITVFIPSMLAVIGSYLYAKDRFFSFVSVTSVTSGLFGTFVGIIATLSNALDSQAIFMGVAVALLPLLYSLFIVLLIVPTLLKK